MSSAAKPLALLQRPTILALYKTILRHAAHFPSSKRQGIIRDIKLDFKDGRVLTDPVKIHAAQSRAVDGLKMLQQYVNLNATNSNTWTLQL